MLDRDSAYHAAELERCKLRPESAQRIRQRLRQECAMNNHRKLLRGRSRASAGRMAHSGQRAKTATFLKAVACLAIIAGIGVLVNTGMVVHETTTHSVERAIAGTPMRPYQRIELEGGFFSCPAAEPPYRETRVYTPSAQYQCGVTARLFLPGISADQCEIALMNAGDARVCCEDLLSLNMEIPPESTRAIATKDTDYLFNITWPIEMTQKKFDEVFGETPGFSWLSREPATFFDSIRDAQLLVTADGITHTYRFNFGDLTDEQSIRREFAHNYKPAIFGLIEENR